MPQTYYTAAPDEDARFQCRHIFPDGRRCASPCLRAEELCYYHHTTRRPIADPHARLARTSTFGLPNPADLNDRSGIQLAIADVLQRIASNDIDPRRAGLLLYGLQTASLNLPKPSATPQPFVPVDDTVEDPNLGTLAPRARIADLVPKSDFEVLLEKYLARNPELDEPESELDEPETEADAQPFTLPDIQATSAQSTLNPNLLRTLPPNPGRGPHRRRNLGAPFTTRCLRHKRDTYPVKLPQITFPRTPRLTRIPSSRRPACVR